MNTAGSAQSADEGRRATVTARCPRRDCCAHVRRAAGRTAPTLPNTRSHGHGLRRHHRQLFLSFPPDVVHEHGGGEDTVVHPPPGQQASHRQVEDQLELGVERGTVGRQAGDAGTLPLSPLAVQLVVDVPGASCCFE